MEECEGEWRGVRHVPKYFAWGEHAGSGLSGCSSAAGDTYQYCWRITQKTVWPCAKAGPCIRCALHRCKCTPRRDGWSRCCLCVWQRRGSEQALSAIISTSASQAAMQGRFGLQPSQPPPTAALARSGREPERLPRKPGRRCGKQKDSRMGHLTARLGREVHHHGPRLHRLDHFLLAIPRAHEIRTHTQRLAADPRPRAPLLSPSAIARCFIRNRQEAPGPSTQERTLSVEGMERGA